MNQISTNLYSVSHSFHVMIWLDNNVWFFLTGRRHFATDTWPTRRCVEITQKLPPKPGSCPRDQPRLVGSQLKFFISYDITCMKKHVKIVEKTRAYWLNTLYFSVSVLYWLTNMHGPHLFPVTTL